MLTDLDDTPAARFQRIFTETPSNPHSKAGLPAVGQSGRPVIDAMAADVGKPDERVACPTMPGQAQVDGAARIACAGLAPHPRQDGHCGIGHKLGSPHASTATSAPGSS